MTSWLLPILGGLSLWATLTALFRFRHPASAGFAVMMVSWTVSEYPLFHLLSQVVVAALLFGGTDRLTDSIGVACFVVSWLGLLAVRFVQTRARASGDRALVTGLGDGYLDALPAERREVLRSRPERGLVWLPVRFNTAGIRFHRKLTYGPEKRNVLDVYCPEELPGESLPVILQVHGGGWMIGNKTQQGQPLMTRLARNGYVAVSINYRLAPKSRFPAQLIDVKRAISWVKDNIEDYGGDPTQIILTGGSAGGHLTSLAALTPNDADYQPGFETNDTSVMACMPFYGPSDFADTAQLRGRTAKYDIFLRHTAMPGVLADHPALYQAMSPITHVNPDAPPFLIIQGSIDVLVWREETKAFADALAAVSTAPVVYWEVPGAQHAFDTFNSQRSAVAVDVCERFAGWVTGTVETQKTVP